MQATSTVIEKKSSIKDFEITESKNLLIKTP